MAGFDLDGYIDVAERIRLFRERFPDGSLQPLNADKPYEVLTISDRVFVVCVEAAYRSADDPRPGVGIAWEPMPGRTPYTKDSELMNAQTSAWGRAIVAVLASDTKKVASREEIRNRQSGREVTTVPEPKPEPVTDVEWFDDFGRRIDACANLPELRGLWSELRAMAADGRVAQADHDGVTAVLKARAEELSTADVPA